MLVEITGILLATTLLMFAYIFFTREKLSSGRYAQSGYQYWIKCLIARLMIRGRKSRQVKNIAQEKNKITSVSKIAHLEKSQSLLDDDNAIDSVYFNGFGSDGSWVIIRMARRPKRHNEIWLTVHLPEIGTLQNPIHPDTAVYNCSPEAFSGGGLRIYPVEPLRTWRITYNGLLRKGISTSSQAETEFETVHVKFSFFFNAVTRVFNFNEDMDPGLMATVLAREPWSREFFDKLKNTNQTHYEQGGELRGYISVDGEEERKMTLKSLRDHTYGVRRWPDFQRYIVHFGWLEDGTYFQASSICLPNTLSSLKGGWVSYPNGEIQPICEIDLDMSNLGANQDPPSSYTFSFKAGFRTYQMKVKINETLRFYHTEKWENVCLENICEFEVNGSIKGKGVAEYCYQREGGDNPNPPQNSVPYVTMDTSFSGPFLYAMSLAQRQCTDPAIVGGKASQLSQLMQLEKQDFHVPKGFCLGIDAFDKHLNENPAILDKIHHLQQVISGKAKDSLEDTCKAVHDEILNTPLSDFLQKVLQDYLKSTWGEAWIAGRISLAVRSSAAGEDSEELSAAGQMDTLLGVKGYDQLLVAIQKCWASNFALPATQYRKQHGQLVYKPREHDKCKDTKEDEKADLFGFDGDNSSGGMGVVIQEMVNAKAAGVLFTRDPVTGNPGLMSLNANYGLGESVVSGEADPDNIVVSRDHLDRVQILRRDIGAKKTALVIDDEKSGTREQVPDHDASARCCISDDVILRLAKIGVQLEKHYADARDIEWAVDGDKIYVLQARPITTLDTLSEWELLHELDTPIGSDTDLMTTGNIGEMMPGAVTPLTASTFIRACDYAMYDMYERAGLFLPYCPYILKMMGMHQNHVFINMDMIHAINEQTHMTGSHQMAQLAILGEVLSDITLEGLERYHGTRGFYQRLTGAIRHYWFMYQSKSKTEALAKTLETLVIGEHCDSAKELYAEIDKMLPLYYQGWCDTICNSGRSAVWSHVLMATITQGKYEWKSEHYSDVAMLLSKCEDVYSADVPAALQALAQKIIESGNADLFVARNSKDAVQWLESSESGEVGQAWETFMNRHGHRCIREAEFREISWRKEPTKLIPAIQTLVKASGNKFSVEERVVDIQEAISRMRTPLSSGAKLALKFIVPKARSSVGAREWGKSVSIQMVDVFKDAYWRLAELMVQESRIPEQDLLMFLQHHEIGTLLETRSAALVAKAQKRRKVIDKQMKAKFPRINFGHPQEIDTNDDKHYVTTSTCFKGLPVSQGQVQGTARVVMSLEEAKTIQPGDVLIVRFTDVGWTPYFPLIGGLVTEIGGLISHGAVVAREYGLPCIVNVPDATRAFTSGETVLLNGSVGTISKVVEE